MCGLILLKIFFETIYNVIYNIIEYKLICKEISYLHTKSFINLKNTIEYIEKNSETLV